MTMQNDAWVSRLAGIGLVSLLFIYVIAQAGKTAPDPASVQKKAYALRRPLFWALIVLGIGVAYGTLRTFPIPKQQGPLHPAQTVNVVAHQWPGRSVPSPSRQEFRSNSTSRARTSTMGSPYSTRTIVCSPRRRRCPDKSILYDILS